MDSALSLLLVEDDIYLRDELVDFMESFFDLIDISDNTKEAYGLYENNSYDLVLTDIQLPNNEDGLVLVEKIRKINPDQIVIVMSAYDEREYYLKSIELGIFSFLVKPFDSNKLMDTMFKVTKYIKQKLNSEIKNKCIDIGPNIQYDMETRYLYVNGSLEVLTQKEEDLLYILLKNADGYVSDEQLRRSVWKNDDVADSTVRVLVKRLREKLGLSDAIVNIKGRGYKISIIR